MEFKIDHRPDFAWLTVQMAKGKTLFVEAGAMATMTKNIKMTTKFKGGLKRFITGESLFLSEFKAEGVDGELTIAPGPFGDIGHATLNGESLYISSSSYVAHTEGIEYETKFQKLSAGILSGAGWFLVKMSGQGIVWFNGYGALTKIDVQNEMLIDNGHIVAFTDSLSYDMVKLGSYKSLFFSGEGFVCRFKGTGKVYVQTKKPSALISWANRFRPVKKSSN